MGTTSRHKRFYYCFTESSGVYRKQRQLVPEIVVAYTTCAPGLIVTRNLDDPKRCNLTHAGSGLAIKSKMPRKALYYIAGALSVVCDWTIADAETMKSVGMEALNTHGLWDWIKS